MYDDLLILWKLNHRHIQLGNNTRNETVGVRLNTGDYRYVQWLGFISNQDARAIDGATPVRLNAVRIGRIGDINTEWTDLPEGAHVQGCLIAAGAYAVVEGNVRVV